MQSHQLKVQRTAHYYTIGTPGKHIKRFWLVCHGYGQAAGRFIHKFDKMDDGETFILAAEGLSRFYFGGFNGPVGASWMTKENREDEIEDYLNLLQTLYDQYAPQFANNVKITFLGFSQGGATITRFAMLRKPKFHHLLLWGTNLAHDINFKDEKEFLSDKKIILAIGNQDEFLTPERVEKVKDFADKQEIKYETILFEGKHEIPRETLHQIAESLS